MLINADFLRSAALMPEHYHWVDSPQNGVERVMLDRVGAEKARATSIVRYAPESYFPQHHHPGGEEIFVLSGTFSADDEDYPAGWYLRSPPQSSHQPYSHEGAVIFVKLWQMSKNENRHVRIDTKDASNWQQEGARQVCRLFSNDSEHVSVQKIRAGEALFTSEIIGGAELLVLEGALIQSGQTYNRGGWIRLPVDAIPQIDVGVQGVTIYLKTGHLTQIEGIDFKEF